MIVLLTTADTEILAAAGALEGLPRGFPAVRCDNPARSEDPGALLDEVLPGARTVVVRLLPWSGPREAMLGPPVA